MKTKLFTFTFILFLFFYCNSQNFTVGNRIVLSNAIPVKKALTEGIFENNQFSDKTLTYLQAGVKFTILEISDDYVKLIALPFNVLNEKQRGKVKGIIKSEYYNDKIYTISLKNFNAFAERVEEKDRISLGVLTLPFKARPQDDFTFDTEFNLSTALNFNIGSFRGASFNWQLGAGIGSVGLNSKNAKGIEDAEAQDVATLTMFSGAMLQYKKVQVGLYIGVDQINNQENYQWDSNGNLWLGFGIGFDVFAISVSSPKNKQSE